MIELITPWQGEPWYMIGAMPALLPLAVLVIIGLLYEVYNRVIRPILPA